MMEEHIKELLDNGFRVSRGYTEIALYEDGSPFVEWEGINEDAPVGFSWHNGIWTRSFSNVDDAVNFFLEKVKTP